MSARTFFFRLLSVSLALIAPAARGGYNTVSFNRPQVDMDNKGTNNGCTTRQNSKSVSGSGASLSAGFDANLIGNDTILVAVHWAVSASTQTLSSVTDTLGNSYTLIATSYATKASTTNFTQIATEFAYSSAVTGGVDTVTANFSGAVTAGTIGIMELSPVTLDQSLSATGNTTTASVGPVITTFAAECAFTAATMDGSFPNPDDSNNWTESFNGQQSPYYAETEMRNVSTAGSVTGTYYPNGAATYFAAAIVTWHKAAAQKGSGTALTGTNQLQWSHQISGINRLLMVTVGNGQYVYSGGSAVTATYNGVAMTPVVPEVRSNGVDFGGLDVFYMVNPPTGNNTVQVTTTGTVGDLEGNSVSFDNVNQTTPFRNVTINFGTGTASSNTTLTTPGDLVFSSFVNGSPIRASSTTGLYNLWANDLNGHTGAGAVAVGMKRAASSSVSSYTSINDDFAFVDIDLVASSNNTVAPPAPSKIALLNVPANVNYMNCVPMLVQTQTAGGVPTSVATPTTIAMVGVSLGATFYSDQQCSNSIGSFVLPAGVTSSVIYFELTASDTLQVTASGLTMGSQAVTVNASFGNNWYLLQSTDHEMWGNATSNTIRLPQATRGGNLLIAACNIATLPAAGTITVSDGAGDTFTASAMGPLVSGSNSEEIFYVLNSTAGATTLTYTNSNSFGTRSGGCTFAEFYNSAGISLGPDTTYGTGTGGQGEVRNSGTTASVNQTIATTVKGGAIHDLVFAAYYTCNPQGFSFTVGITVESNSWSPQGAGTTGAAVTPFGISGTETSNNCSYMYHAITFKP